MPKNSNADAPTDARGPKSVIPPGGRMVGPFGVIVIALYLIVLSSLLVYGLLVFWPSAGAPSTARFLTLAIPVTDETRMILVVVISGALGGSIHSIRSLYWYVGQRMFMWHWALMYVLLPFGGATLGLAAYVVIRGGFFSGATTVSEVNPFSFAALAVLVGLFSVEAYEWLREIASKFFKPAPTGKDDAPPTPPGKGSPGGPHPPPSAPSGQAARSPGLTSAAEDVNQPPPD